MPKSNWCIPARHRLDDWSNTWAAIVYTPPATSAASNGKLLYKYGAFDPWGKQSHFADPYMHVLFNLTADPYELVNIYNQTKFNSGPVGAALVATMETKLRAFVQCKGDECRMAAGEAVAPVP